MAKKNYLLKKVSLTGLKVWLNENKEKANGKEITISDTQQYATKYGKLPDYMGGNKIEVNEKTQFESRSYNLFESEKKKVK